jgi:LacI family transcriptional regulator, galactose operon repressor
MRVRMKDIAAELNVSVVTVSKVLRNHSDISIATRERVLQRMKELDYRPNLAARTLVTGRTFMIGLIVPDLVHPFFGEIARTLSQAIRAKGYNLVIASSEGDAELERHEIDSLTARQVDALVLASAQTGDVTFNYRTPIVLIDRQISGIAANFVGVNDEKVGYLATRHLIDCGYQRIAHIHGPALSPGRQRFEGYRRALAEEGRPFLPEYVVDSGEKDIEGLDAMNQLLAVHPRPDAVFAFNDPVAISALKAVFQAGLRVPHDVALIGAGNFRHADLLRVPLSTVDQANTAIGEQAAKLVLKVIESKTKVAPKSILLDPALIIRESSRRP